MKLYYYGDNIPAIKNNKQLITNRGKPRLIDNPKRKFIMLKMAKQFRNTAKKTITNYPIHLSIKFLLSNNRKRDLDNMVNTVFDALVIGNVIEDDSYRHIASFEVRYEKNKVEGVEIEINFGISTKESMENFNKYV